MATKGWQKKKDKKSAAFYALDKKWKKARTKKKLEAWVFLSKYFCPLFSPIWGDCVLVGSRRKLLHPTKIHPLFPLNQTTTDTIFSPLFSPLFSILPIITTTKQGLKFLQTLNTILLFLNARPCYNHIKPQYFFKNLLYNSYPFQNSTSIPWL